jgi:electron transfer flavoprotein beta subunit
MHIVVAIKSVHDPNTPAADIGVGPDEKALLLPRGSATVLNGYDANAVEEAVRIKEKICATISVLSVGDEQAKVHLRRGLAMGADSALHLAGPGGVDCDSHLVASLLCAAIRKLGPVDLVLCGRQASDTDAGQVPMMLAEYLHMSAVSPVRQLSLAGDKSVVVDRVCDGGIQRLQAHLPVLLGISGEINTPRAPSLKGVMQARKASIATWTAADLGLENPAPALKLRRLFIEPKPDAPTEFLQARSADQAGRALADRLWQEGLL